MASFALSFRISALRKSTSSVSSLRTASPAQLSAPMPRTIANLPAASFITIASVGSVLKTASTLPCASEVDVVADYLAVLAERERHVGRLHAESQLARALDVLQREAAGRSRVGSQPGEQRRTSEADRLHRFASIHHGRHAPVLLVCGG